MEYSASVVGSVITELAIEVADLKMMMGKFDSIVQ